MVSLVPLHTLDNLVHRHGSRLQLADFRDDLQNIVDIAWGQVFDLNIADEPNACRQIWLSCHRHLYPNALKNSLPAALGKLNVAAVVHNASGIRISEIHANRAAHAPYFEALKGMAHSWSANILARSVCTMAALQGTTRPDVPSPLHKNASARRSLNEALL